jgi:hypothetical protein
MKPSIHHMEEILSNLNKQDLNQDSDDENSLSGDIDERLKVRKHNLL